MKEVKLSLSSEIEKMGLSKMTTTRLKENEIVTVEGLWNLSRIQLKSMKFSNDEINAIIIKLQLIGLDLNKRKY